MKDPMQKLIMPPPPAPPSHSSSRADETSETQAPRGSAPSSGQDRLAEQSALDLGGSSPNLTAPTPQKPDPKAGSVNMQAASVKTDGAKRASADITNVRITGGAQILTLRYYPHGAHGAETPILYEVALPRGGAGSLESTDHHQLAISLAKLIQTAETHCAKNKKMLTSFTFSKPIAQGAPPSLVLVIDEGAKKDVVDLSQEEDAHLPHLDTSLHTELKRMFDHLQECLHLPLADRTHAKITRLATPKALDPADTKDDTGAFPV